jgi:putative two-component system response regulator
LLERILQQGGYRNSVAITDPRQVLQLFTLHQPDLILLDLLMPHVDGFALMTQLRSRIPEGHYLPVLVLTADATPKAKHKALSLGAKDFLTKPFDASEVLLRVYNLLETRWLYVQLQQHIAMLEEQSSVGESSHDLEASALA